ncbi:DNA/RNA nuclease SfsA [Exiguobacterium sp. s193]|uniref:DNA/RNA nuclease SfsA n=1 Tax=Exiguobacterium sp. s193 TaxID=2751207 RepID=UPI001BE55572|nr:DNA/RNA nuclease SfsA [Exiguobacterium sp. s193]
MFNGTETIEGTFIKESKNRFLCEVLIDNQLVECYVPSSSRIENYLKLSNKKVLLTKNIGSKSRTKYSLFAVMYYNKYVILNLNKVNELLTYYIEQNEFVEAQIYTIEKEKTVNGYKTDLIIYEPLKSEEKIIEAKGIIGITREVLFPKVHSERALKQLEQISILLRNNYIVEYYFVSLSPIVKKVIINSSHSKYYKLLNECIENGLRLKGIGAILNKEKEVSFVKIKVEIM